MLGEVASAGHGRRSTHRGALPLDQHRSAARPRLLRAALTAVVVTAMLAAILGVGSAAAPAADAATSKNPILLTHGLTADSSSWVIFKSRLEKDGFKVFTVDIPNRGLGDIAENSKTVRDKVTEIRKKTGATKVDLIGHSEGGLENRYYLKAMGGTQHVERYISLGTPNYGTYMANIVNFYPINEICVACEQMTVNSIFLAGLNANDDTPGAVKYTSIYTKYDELVVPAGNAALKNGAVNSLVQNVCPYRVVGHVGLVLDGTVYQMTRAALRDQTPSRVNVDCWAL